MSLSVLVKSASGLPNVDRFSKSDPMCVITLQVRGIIPGITTDMKECHTPPTIEKLRSLYPSSVLSHLFNYGMELRIGEKKKTKVIEDNLDPEWNENLNWTLPAALSTSDVLNVKVYDHENIGGNRLLGMLDLDLHDVITKGKQPVSRHLTAREGVVMTWTTINLDLTYTAPADAGDRWDGEGDEEGVDDMGGEEVGKGGEGKGGKGKKGRRGGRDPGRQRLSQQKVSASRSKLPNKPLDFQVLMHFLEARKLVGGAVNPMVKVVCGNEIKKTSTRKETNRPFWDEMLCFNFKERPDEMFDKVVEIKVLDAKKVISDSLIGSFKFDLGMVYDAGRCYIHKWLLLTNPNDSAAGVKGYLKFSIQILGAGDDPKPSPSEMSSDDVDIEANLLRPSSVRLTAATMHIRIFQGQDFPQMDPGYFEGVKRFLHVGTVQKELVDPYCTVAFAGHEGSTQVIWNERDPEWNHQINLSVRFPSMCERLRFQVKDKDKLNPDDYIGTCYLNLSQISHPGYLPTFGPCFINMYGSPREFSDLPDKYDHLNKGLIEGVAYRGRVMVQVDTTLGALTTDKHQEIKLADRNKIMPYLCHQKYKLYGVFFSATMVYPSDAAVQFEISIGNYGNKLDTTTPAQSSTTPPTNPAYDGNKYYFLPWLDQKPCTTVDSWWQDCTFRIESLNIIISTADTLEKELKAVNMTGVDVDPEGQLGTVLENFLENLDQRLPKLHGEGKVFTQLDKRTREYRKQEWKRLRDDAKHIQLHLTDYKPKEMFAKCEEYVQRLRSLAVEPQNCVPDVIIWMLSGNKRVACKRIPSHLLMYSSLAKARGKLCGEVQTIFLTPPAVQKEEELGREGAQVRLMLWLGLEKDSSKWSDGAPGGDITIFAEAYENQAYVAGKWFKSPIRPHLSDSRGRIKIPEPKEDIKAPTGWRWEGIWHISPEPSVAYKLDDSLDEWTEDVFENQVRQLPLLTWHKSYWSNIRGDKLTELDGKEKKELARDDIKAPDGWLWKTEWEIDNNRAVNEDGWEYSVEAEVGPWVPYERNFHLFRRRRWVRLRKKDKDSKTVEKEEHKRMKAVEEEGWEYARLPILTYHNTEHCLDFARRRRWLCKLVATDPSQPPIFHLGAKEKKEDGDEELKDANETVPRMFLTFKESHTYQLRAYLYQARCMHGSDKSGLSDPYAVLAFSCKSTCSRDDVKQTLCPTWDQTLIIKHLRFFGNPQSIRNSPPPVVIEFFDKDTIGQHDYIGKAVVIPTVNDTVHLRLDWHKIELHNKYAGELLAAFELLDEAGELPVTPPIVGSPPHTYYFVPCGIRPTVQKTRIEVLCLGVRDMKRYQLLEVTSPLVELECGGNKVKSTKHIEDVSKNPNFPQRIITMDVYLPKEKLYAPPLYIHIRDKGRFNLPIVGTHIIKSLKGYGDPVQSDGVQAHTTLTPADTTPTPTHTSPPSVQDGEVAVAMEDSEPTIDPDLHAHTKPDPGSEKKSTSQNKSDFDWWTKYHYAIGNKDNVDDKDRQEYVEAGCDSLKVYRSELEDNFNFADLAQTFPLHRGQEFQDPEDIKAGGPVGYFKGLVATYPLDSPDPKRKFVDIPSADPISVIVRVYVIKGIQLQPRDLGGKSDPYLKVKIGKKEMDSKENYIPNQLNPIFGQMFELPALLPLDHTLTVTVMDWDRFAADDLIGATSIDIENRYLSQHRATCGLPKTYFVRGPNKWRDRESTPPVHILDEWCKLKSIANPVWSDDHKEVVINGKPYYLNQFEKGNEPYPDMGAPQQRLALHFLRQQGLVPEHIETRNLYMPMQPNMSQGQLHMWVDIFPNDGNIPAPVDISPRKPVKYVLRIIVWNTKDVILDDDSIVTGEAMSDIYVKGWLKGEDETQRTDVHYRSLDGEGNFNWRFVFPFMCIPAEQVMVVRMKEHIYSLTETEKHLPRSPRLTLQVWDADHFTLDDFLGTLDLNLWAMPEPKNSASSCSLGQLPEEAVVGEKAREVKLVSLFKRKRMKGWWAVYRLEKEGEREKRELTGKLELEIEVVSEEEEKLRPAGKARDDPNMNPVLYPPIRPVTSFLWFVSPWRTFKFIIWRRYKRYFILGIILILLVVLIIIFIYTLPNTLMSTIINRIIPS